VRHDAGIAFADLREQWGRQQRRRTERGQTDRDVAGQLRLVVQNGAPGFFNLPLDRLGIAVEDSSGLGGLDPAGAAVEQLALEIRLQARNVLTQCRLRNIQHLRRARHAAEIHDLDEGLQTFRIQYGLSGYPGREQCSSNRLKLWDQKELFLPLGT